MISLLKVTLTAVISNLKLIEKLERGSTSNSSVEAEITASTLESSENYTVITECETNENVIHVFTYVTYFR